MAHTRWVGLVATCVVAGLALGRFVSIGGDGTVQPAVVRRPASTIEQVAALESTVAQRPGDVGALRELATAYLRRALETSDPTFVGLAERALQKATEAAPDDVGVLVARATVALTRHEFASALQLAERARVEAPGDDEPLLVATDALVELGRYDEAVATLD